MIKQDTSENLAKGIFLAIGSNLGDRITNIEKAKSLLIDYKVKLTKISNYYETPSWLMSVIHDCLLHAESFPITDRTMYQLQINC